MKKLIFLLSLTMLLAGCSKPDQEVKKTKAEAAANGFYVVRNQL